MWGLSPLPFTTQTKHGSKRMETLGGRRERGDGFRLQTKRQWHLLWTEILILLCWLWPNSALRTRTSQTGVLTCTNGPSHASGGCIQKSGEMWPPLHTVQRSLRNKTGLKRKEGTTKRTTFMLKLKEGKGGNGETVQLISYSKKSTPRKSRGTGSEN